MTHAKVFIDRSHFSSTKTRQVNKLDPAADPLPPISTSPNCHELT